MQAQEWTDGLPDTAFNHETKNIQSIQTNESSDHAKLIFSLKNPKTKMISKRPQTTTK